MATESPIRISERTDRWSTLNQSSRYPSSAKMAIEGLDLFLKDQRFQSLEKDVIPSRSGSAPPSMEGSTAAVENMFSHWKSAINQGALNSLESSHTFQSSGSAGSRKMTRAKRGDDSLQLLRNKLPAHEEESEDDQSSEQSVSVSVRKGSLSGYHSGSLDSTQEDSYYGSSTSYGHSVNDKSTEETVVSNADSHICVSVSSAGTKVPCPDDMRQILTDFSTIKVDEQDHLSTAGAGEVDNARIDAVKNVNIFSASNSGSHKFHKKEQLIPQNNALQQQAAPQECSTSRVQGNDFQTIYPGMSHAYSSLHQFQHGSSHVSTADVQPTLQSSGFTPPLYASAAAFMASPSPFYPNLQPAGFYTPQYSMGGYNFNSTVLPSYLSGYRPHQDAIPTAFDGASFPTSGVSNGGIGQTYDLQNLLKFYGQAGIPLQPPFHMQYFQPPVRDSYGSYSNFHHQASKDGAVRNQVSPHDSKKGPELVGLSNDYTAQHFARAHNNLNLKRENMSSHYYFGNPSVVSPLVQSKPAAGTNFPGGRYNMNLSHSSSGNPSRTNGQSQSWNYMNSYSFLEELKSGKGQRLELSDIAGHIVEFSVDQHGSRFIQQKLETCNVEEKASVFKEVVPHASKLMTDVFGNYVIQKLFEHGSPEQRKCLANQLEDQILTLSLQMYGCRVIQKALDVIDSEQKARLVRELDGHVLGCVRDQNGNHVIQKCIESIPTDDIHFIISSFRGQVATLSMHPYGCRVIQRVLEHCNDDIHTQFIVDEILGSVCSLAQDQYGNYVTQHVLERGNTRERSEIIEKLAGSIVQLSQHKFASNVVEKCLEYSDSTARGMLIKEIIGHGDKNENLLIMMKDQYANYVIQKILEKCSSDERELLLGLIKNHLTALKKYTYGKHIVARFEKLYGDEIQTLGS